jgi:hypothetical protein
MNGFRVGIFMDSPREKLDEPQKIVAPIRTMIFSTTG